MSMDDYERAFFRCKRALAHLMHKNHDLTPDTCDGCKEVALFVTLPGYRSAVELVFNDTAIVANPGDSPDAVAADWCRLHEANRLAAIPLPPDGLPAEFHELWREQYPHPVALAALRTLAEARHRATQAVDLLADAIGTHAEYRDPAALVGFAETAARSIANLRGEAHGAIRRADALQAELAEARRENAELREQADQARRHEKIANDRREAVQHQLVPLLRSVGFETLRRLHLDGTPGIADAVDGAVRLQLSVADATMPEDVLGHVQKVYRERDTLRERAEKAETALGNYKTALADVSAERDRAETAEREVADVRELVGLWRTEALLINAGEHPDRDSIARQVRDRADELEDVLNGALRKEPDDE